MKLKLLKHLVLIFSLISTTTAIACDGLDVTIVSNVDLGNGTYELTIRYCEEVSNGGTSAVSGIILDVPGANILSTSTPSFTSSTTGVTINYNVIDANTVQWGEWDDNPNVPDFMDEGDPEECFNIVVIVDALITSVTVAGSSASIDEGNGFVNWNGRYTCRTNESVPPPACNPIPPTFNPIAPVCQGSSLVLPTTSTNGQTGTWAPVVNTSTPGTINYTFTPSGGGCITSAVLPVTVNAATTPTFTQVAPICSGGSFTLPTTSTNGVNGTWSPAINNTATTTYTFTPSAGQCANTTTMSVTVNAATTPTFTQVAPICTGGSFTLPTTSNNGITGSWSPAINNSATTTYTFTPNAGQCANTTTMTVTVGLPTTPTFTQVAPICSGGSFTLPPTSNNGITGTWSPAINNTATTTYTFTPNAGQCANTTTMTVTVGALTTPTFTQVAPICSGGSFTLPTTSNNGITGSWSPAINNTATTTYTFTPNAGQCANTTTMTVTVNPQTVPTFTQVPAICSGGSFTLPITSNNGINGTWSPAINNTATTTYTFTPTAGQCATTTTMTVSVGAPNAPLFTQVAPICTGGSFSLPTTSNDGYTGSWSPAVNNTATTTYTFTPDAGQCAINTTMTVTVNPEVTPTFTQVAPICTGGSFTLPATSNNGINGTWSPAIDNTATTMYTFTPDPGQCATTTTMTVVVDPQITPTYTQVTPICTGGSFTLPTTSDNGYTGSWSPAINNTATTTYTFTPDPGQCATTTTMTVTVDSQITPTFTQVAPICSGGSIILPGTSDNGYTGVWSPAINNTATTTYTFTPDPGQCATTTTMTVVVDPQITPTFVQIAPICFGGAFALPTTSDNGYTGAWSPAINNTATTTYTFTPDPGQCATTTTMTVVIDPQITPAFSQVAPICFGGAFVLPTTSDNGYIGAWSPAIDNTATTTYTFTPDPGQCATTTTMTVVVDPQITPTFVQIAPICFGGAFVLPTTSVNGFTGVWSPAIDNTTTTTYTFTPDPGQCATTTTMTVTVEPLPVVDAGFDQAICIGSSTVLTATGATTYVWDNGGVNGQTVSPTTTTTYTVIGTLGICTDTDEVIITVNPLPQVAFTPDVMTGCEPLDVNFSLQSPPGVACTWDFGDGTNDVGCGAVSHTYNGVGCYDVSMTTTDANGCVNSRTYPNLICLVAYPVAEFGTTPSVITTTNPVSTMVNTSQGAVSYVWDFGDESATSTAFEPEHTFPFGEGNSYTIMLVADNGYGCTDTAYHTIRVEEDIIFYVPNTFTPDGDNYNQYFTPVFTSGFDPYDYSLFIYDRWGELIFESHDSQVGWDGKYAGTYEVQDGTYTWKIEFKQSMNDKRRTEIGHVTLIR